MLLSTSSGFVFFHIPKTGGVSTRATLEKYKDIDHGDYSHTRHWEQDLRKKFDPMHINQIQAKEMYDLSKLTEFTLVREPLQRLVSLYNYGDQSRTFRSFDKFMRVVAKHYQSPTIYRELFNSQLYWITDKTIILKLEDVIKDPIKEFSKLNIDISTFKKINENVKSKYLPTPSEIDFCLDFLTEEYTRLNYKKPKRIR
jgi:hypothetical protein